MTNPQRTLREQTECNPILSMKPLDVKNTVSITTYCIHDLVGRVETRLVHIPGSNDDVLQYIEKLCANGWKEIWLDSICHVLHEEDSITFEEML